MTDVQYICRHEDEESAEVCLTCDCGNLILDHEWILHDSVFVCTECDRNYVARWKGMVIEPVKQRDPESR